MQRNDSQPTTLEQLDICIDALSLPGNTPLSPLDGGFNSKVFRAADLVVKISRFSGSAEAAAGLAQVMEAEHRRMATFISDHLPFTTYQVAASRQAPSLARVLTIQDFVDGPILPDYLAGTDFDTAEIVSFLKRCTGMYRDIWEIPDLANIQTGFSIFRNSNVVVSTDEHGQVIPMLTDTNYGKIQRSRRLGPLWSWAIYRGVERGIKKLESG